MEKLSHLLVRWGGDSMEKTSSCEMYQIIHLFGTREWKMRNGEDLQNVSRLSAERFLRRDDTRNFVTPLKAFATP